MSVVLIAGASSGIGRAAALQVSAEGDHVVLVARGKAALRATAAECEAAGAASVLVVPTDVGDEAAVARCIAKALRTHERIDLVLNCAGVVAYGRVEEVPADVFDGVLRTNLIGAVNVARHVVPVLRGQEHGSRMYVGSVIGHIAVPLMSSYVLSKWGVRALARQLQVENRDLHDVHIGYIAPGGVDTPIYRQAATYVGAPGRPPRPVASPERAARAALARARGSNAREQVGLANDLIRFGFTALPQVYDVLVGPLFRVAAMDLTDPWPPGTGNVLEPGQDNALRGSQDNALRRSQGNAVVGIARNVRSIVSARPRLKPGS